MCVYVHVCVRVWAADSSGENRKMPGGSLSEKLVLNLKEREGLWQVTWGWGFRGNGTYKDRGLGLFQEVYLDGAGHTAGHAAA